MNKKYVLSVHNECNNDCNFEQKIFIITSKHFKDVGELICLVSMVIIFCAERQEFT